MKKAQATAYIIIGLIIIITAGILVYLQSKAAEETTQAQLERPAPVFAGQAELRDFVDNCIQDAVLGGLEVLRTQSGYIRVPTGTAMLEAQGNQMPYWLTADQVAIPSLDFMENELENYVTDEVEACTGNFEDFKQQGFAVEAGAVEVAVDMDAAVIATVSYPITMVRGEAAFTEDGFSYRVPIDMASVHKIASDLAALESFHTYLEDHTKNTISLYSGVDPDRLPPFTMSTTNFDCSFTTWSKQAVEKNLKNILSYNLQNLKVEGTDYELPRTGSEFQAVYESFIYDLLAESHPDVEVDFVYNPMWDFLQYDIVPNAGDLLAPDKVSQAGIPMIARMCVFRYPFKYTLQYPVVVQVTDKNSARIDPDAAVYYEKAGFTFQFPLVAYLCGNNERQCNNVNQQYAAASLAPADGTLAEPLFCDPEQRLSSDLTVKTLDSITGAVVGNVDVNYRCGSNRNYCFIGRTNENGFLRGKLPLCINGELYLDRQGYAQKQEGLTTYNAPSRTINYFLDAAAALDVGVKKIAVKDLIETYIKTGTLSVKDAVDATKKDQVTIVSDTGLFYLYPDPEGRTIELAPGEVVFTLNLASNLTIQPAEINGQSIPGFSGTYPAGSTTIPYTVTKGDTRKGKVTFFAFAEFDPDKEVTLSGISDPLLKENGTIEAEVLYRCAGSNSVCNFEDCSILDSDGTLAQDFIPDEGACEKRGIVAITPEQYLPSIPPQFSS